MGHGSQQRALPRLRHPAPGSPVVQDRRLGPPRHRPDLRSQALRQALRQHPDQLRHHAAAAQPLEHRSAPAVLPARLPRHRARLPARDGAGLHHLPQRRQAPRRPLRHHQNHGQQRQHPLGKPALHQTRDDAQHPALHRLPPALHHARRPPQRRLATRAALPAR